jgi:hypothetical protein
MEIPILPPKPHIKCNVTGKSVATHHKCLAKELLNEVLQNGVKIVFVLFVICYTFTQQPHILAINI